MNPAIRKQLSRRCLKKRRFFTAQHGGAHIVCDYKARHYVHLKVAIPSYVIASTGMDAWTSFCRALACYPEALDRLRAELKP